MSLHLAAIKAGIASMVACTILLPGTPQAGGGAFLGRWKVESVFCAGGACALDTPLEAEAYLAQVQGLTLDLVETPVATQVALPENLMSCEQGVDLTGIKSQNTWAFIKSLPRSSLLRPNAFQRFLKNALNWTDGNGMNPMRTNLANESQPAGQIRCKGSSGPGAWVIQAKPGLIDYYDPEAQYFLVLRREPKRRI